MSAVTFPISGEIRGGNALESLFWARFVEGKEGLKYTRHCGWTSDADPDVVFQALPEGTETRAYEYRRTRLWAQDGLLILIEWNRPLSWEITVAGETVEAAEDFITDFRSRVPEMDTTDTSTVPITFWALQANGSPSGTTRRVTSHHWRDIRGNYPIDVRTRLDDLMQIDPPEESGKLVLWHGPPGTGKTNCIRALADAWRDWCDVDNVVDPEELFGHAHYMMNCLVNGGRVESGRWRLIVIEDSGEFLKKDAKAMSGQAFGRLLNITDGLVGQGLKLIVLVTTNEPFSDLHDAVSRPGRCLSHMEFGTFSPDEASKWLGEKVVREYTLADLYEARADHQPQITKEHQEFRPGVYA